MKKSIFLLSSSNVHGHGYLEYNKGALLSFLEGISTPILFVPFAAGKSEWDSYTAKIATFFAPAGIAVEGIHTVAADRIFTGFEVIFIGGGNTFRLLHQLQQANLLTGIREAVLTGRMSYIGSSAGTNMACKSIRTSNDMPIVYPEQGFEALDLFPYQVNAHYMDPDPNSSHMGETRAQRIAEFHQENDMPVIGLREGSYLHLAPDFRETNELFIGGSPGAKIFLKGKDPYEAITEEHFIFTP